MLKFTV